MTLEVPSHSDPSPDWVVQASIAPYLFPMRSHLRLAAVLTVAAVAGLFSLPAAADVPFVLEGTVAPESIATGGTLTVTYTVSGAVGACDDFGPDQPPLQDNTANPLDPVSYSNRPLIFGLFPTSVTLTDWYFPTAWYVEGTPLSELGYVTSAGILPTSEYDRGNQSGATGWQGTFTGTVVVPLGLPAGTYNAVWGCGFPIQPNEALGWDTQSPAITGVIEVGDTPIPDGIALTLDFSTGANVREGNALVPVSGGGLLPGAPYTVVLRSDPVQIGAGVVGPRGSFSASYPIPSDTPPGAHSVTVTSLNASGEEVSAVAWFYVDESGTVLGVSYDGPITPRFTG